MLDFIREGQLAALIGDCLFIHGGVGPSHLGYVPPAIGQTEGTTYGQLEQWVDQLYAWASQQVEDYLRHPTWYVDASGKVVALSGDGVLPGFLSGKLSNGLCDYLCFARGFAEAKDF